jgi:hypothetical protein
MEKRKHYIVQPNKVGNGILWLWLHCHLIMIVIVLSVLNQTAPWLLRQNDFVVPNTGTWVSISSLALALLAASHRPTADVRLVNVVLSDRNYGHIINKVLLLLWTWSPADGSLPFGRLICAFVTRPGTCKFVLVLSSGAEASLRPAGLVLSSARCAVPFAVVPFVSYQWLVRVFVPPYRS